MYVSELLPVVVLHDEIGFAFFDGPRRREAAGRQWSNRLDCDLGHSLDHAFVLLISLASVRRDEAGEAGVTVFDYVAIGVLIVLFVWAIPFRFPRGRL